MGKFICPQEVISKLMTVLEDCDRVPATRAAAVKAEITDTGRLSQIERAMIIATLEECDGNRTQTAKKLGISRRSLIYKLRDIDQENL